MKILFRNFSLAFLFFLLPKITHACAVCFGATPSNMSRGFFWGILVLLILPFAMFVGFFTTIVRATKKNKDVI